MTKYTNPFHTIEEAIALLKSYGTNPLQSGATYPAEAEESKPGWPERILGITLNKRYDNCTHSYDVIIQLTEEGFEEVVSLIGSNGTAVPIKHRPYANEFNELSIEPSPMLKLITLVPKEDNK